MRKISYYLVYILFVFAFTKGLFELIGVSDTIIQLIIDFLILILFLISIKTVFNSYKINFPGFIIIFILVIVVLLSFLLSDVSTLQLILFIRKIGIYPIFFFSLLNLYLTEKEKEKIVNILKILFLIQIPAAFIKLIILGGTLEKIVGTVSLTEGSLATTMPLFGIIYLIVYYLEYKKLSYIFLILCFISIGLISNKLGILFYVIGLFIFLSYLYSKPKLFLPNFIFLKKLSINVFYLLIICMLFISLNPRANPEHKIGGSIDFVYLEKYINDYQTLDLKTGVEGDGRADAPFVALSRLESSGLTTLLFGFGPGEIVESSFTKYENPLLEKYNIGYGGRLGVVWIVMQIGVLGLIIFLTFHLYLLKRMLYIYKKIHLSTHDNILVLIAIGFSVLFFIDFFTYSSGMIISPAITLVYYFSIYYILQLSKEKEIN